MKIELDVVVGHHHGKPVHHLLANAIFVFSLIQALPLIIAPLFVDATTHLKKRCLLVSLSIRPVFFFGRTNMAVFEGKKSSYDTISDDEEFSSVPSRYFFGQR